MDPTQIDRSSCFLSFSTAPIENYGFTAGLLHHGSSKVDPLIFVSSQPLIALIYLVLLDAIHLQLLKASTA